MFSVKKILKRTLVGLKMATAWAPIILTPAGLLTFVGTGIGYIATLPSYSEYTESAIFQQEFVNDLERYKESYENGYMTQTEYVNKITSMDEEDYIKEVLGRDIEGNEEWRAHLKDSNTPLGIASLSCLGASILSGVLLIPWLAFDVKDDLEWSADDDFDWQPPKKEKKPKKVNQPIEKKKSVVDESENGDTNKISDDISDDQERFGTTDDFISSLQQ